jgi:hypothetical protein
MRHTQREFVHVIHARRPVSGLGHGSSVRPTDAEAFRARGEMS